MGVNAWPDALPVGDLVTLPSGSLLASEGQRLVSAHVIESGVVSLSRRARGADVVFGLRSTGATVGASIVVTGDPYDATVRTVGEVRVWPIAIRALRSARHESGPVAVWFDRTLVDDCARQVRWTIALSARSATVRLAAVLAELFRECGEGRPDGSRRLAVPETVEHLASVIHVTRERASRAMRHLNQAGVVKRERGGWFIAPARSSLLRALVVAAMNVLELAA